FMEFHEILTELLKTRKITAYQISKDTGISQTAIGKWKKGEQYPTADKLKLLADYLVVTTDYLLTGKETTFKTTTIEMPSSQLTENEKELLNLFKQLSDREQLKLIGKVEGMVEEFQKNNLQENVG
ncbi:MAG: helix-turn-helix domain-containing protein, partial [Ruminococcus sp.]|nr:helix-turn-helix domain-containing protein [Ruminococcus sp.]